VPDETALTSTAWMGGVFHSMLTQGHVSINRCLSTTRSWLGLFRGHGQRVFVRSADGPWQQLGVPSAFEMRPDGCRWLYAHDGGLIEAVSRIEHEPHAMGLRLRVVEGVPLEFRVTHHVALGGDLGSRALPLPLHVRDTDVFVGVPPGSELAARFPRGGLQIRCGSGMRAAAIAGDGALYPDGLSRHEPYVVIDSPPTLHFALWLQPALVPGTAPQAQELPLPRWQLPEGGTPDVSPARQAVERLAEVVPWYAHNALVHYLSPRGLEQYSGGGWGTRDVCQGPLELLLALDRTAAARDLLCRVFSAQDASGDWPQWFMFFERERHIRAGDSHGDIVFWPLLALGRYLLATGDAGLLETPLPFQDRKSTRLNSSHRYISRMPSSA
jgi:hypothetical protein